MKIFGINYARAALLILRAFYVSGAPSDDPTYTDMTDLMDELGEKVATLYYRLDALDASQLPAGAGVDVDGVNAISMKMIYDKLAWLSVGISPDGSMIGSEVVIGVPLDDSNTPNPAKYGPLTAKNSAGVTSTKLAADAQTLIDARIEQDGSQTVLAFTKALTEAGETPIDSTGQNVFAFAIGGDQSFPSFHSGGYGIFSLDLSTVSRPILNLTEAMNSTTTNSTDAGENNSTSTQVDANDVEEDSHESASYESDSNKSDYHGSDSSPSVQESDSASSSVGYISNVAKVLCAFSCALLSITLY